MDDFRLGNILINEFTQISEIPRLFDSACRAQKIWQDYSIENRVKLLLDLREQILNEVDNIVDLICEENGKPRFEALFHDVFPVIETISYFAKVSAKLLKPKRIKIRNPILKDRKSCLYYFPLGVVGIISPWNFPFFLPLTEICMALFCGNAVLFKPSELAIRSGQKIQQLIEQISFPEGLCQIIIGGPEQGRALVENKPNKIFFTGSVAVGQQIAQRAAEMLIPVNLELGGKDPMIVLEDVNLEFATSAAVWGVFANSGQMCASTERLLVHESIYDQFITRLKQKINQLKHGNPDQDVDLTFSTSEKQLNLNLEQITQARDLGHEILLGGKLLDPKTLAPTLVKIVNDDSVKILAEETFGPLATVETFSSDSQAIELANSTKYGLTATILTGDFLRAEKIAQKLIFGTITINEVAYTASLPETPWRGVKQSGMGYKHSAEGLYEFCRVLHLHSPRTILCTHQALWWFPYTKEKYVLFKEFLKFYKTKPIEKIKAFVGFSCKFIKFIFS